MDDEDKRDCAICLANIEENDKVISTRCPHISHKGCLLEWMKKSRTCTECREPVEEIMMKKSRKIVPLPQLETEDIPMPLMNYIHPNLVYWLILNAGTDAQQMLDRVLERYRRSAELAELNMEFEVNSVSEYEEEQDEEEEGEGDNEEEEEDEVDVVSVSEYSINSDEEEDYVDEAEEDSGDEIVLEYDNDEEVEEDWGDEIVQEDEEDDVNYQVEEDYLKEEGDSVDEIEQESEEEQVEEDSSGDEIEQESEDEEVEGVEEDSGNENEQESEEEEEIEEDSEEEKEQEEEKTGEEEDEIEEESGKEEEEEEEEQEEKGNGEEEEEEIEEESDEEEEGEKQEVEENGQEDLLEDEIEEEENDEEITGQKEPREPRTSKYFVFHVPEEHVEFANEVADAVNDHEEEVETERNQDPADDLISRCMITFSEDQRRQVLKRLRASDSIIHREERRRQAEPIIQSVDPPGDISLQPDNKVTINAPRDITHIDYVQVTNTSSHRNGWVMRTTMISLVLAPGFGLLGPNESVRIPISCTGAYLDDVKGHFLTFEWSNASGERSFSRMFHFKLWFERRYIKGGVRQMILPVEFNI
ncbi:hypothetical protein PRIPAC_95936 [Pristionchus pacificus]|nr:hypothetical protein PRIPAC_95936 [Pristionchus pacificus]